MISDSNKIELSDPRYVTYEDFGAAGDGETDDLQAIYHAHCYANAHDLPVQTRWDATYYIGGGALTVPIETDTNWGSSHFVIDDRAVEDNKASVFHVCSRFQRLALQNTNTISKLHKDQTSLSLNPELQLTLKMQISQETQRSPEAQLYSETQPNQEAWLNPETQLYSETQSNPKAQLDTDCFVSVKNSHIKHFIRFGPNVNSGTDQSDVFILRKDGTIDSPIDWDYDEITELQIMPMDSRPLQLEGGIFTTIANQGPSIYDYYERNILITRSNTTVQGIVHYVAGELSHGSPYNGFIHATDCANIRFEELFSTGHKMYYTIGSAGVSVPMGSYDLRVGRVCNFSMKNCRTNNILDRSRWGTIATDFCKNIRLEGCVLSRIDTHQGVSGVYELRDCSFGHMGIKAIGRGRLLIDNVTSYGNELLELRPDYGSTWDGTVEIYNSRYIPACGNPAIPHIFHVQNSGIHNFGYLCRMPRDVVIDGLEICDKAVPEGYTGPYFCTDPDTPSGFENGPLPAVRPYPYLPPDKITLKNVHTSSGKSLQFCENADWSQKLSNALSH